MPQFLYFTEMKIARLLLFVTLIGCRDKEEPMSESVETYLTAMLNVMEENHVNRKDIDWASFRNNVLAKAKGVQSIKDAYSAVSLALTDLDDNVSFVKYETYLLVGDFTKSCSNGNGASQPVGHVDGVSYINMYPSFAGDDTPFGSSGI
jgi:hypothetical protein